MEGRQYIGFEIVKEYYDFINERLTTNQYRIKDKTNCVEPEYAKALFT